MSSDFEFDKTIEAEEADLNRRNRAARRRNLLILALAFLAVLFGIVSGFLAMDNHRLAEVNALYGAAQAQEKKDIAQDVEQNLCKAGEIPKTEAAKTTCQKVEAVATEPADPPATAAPPPIIQAIAPTAEELRLAVATYCSNNRCRGADGLTPTPEDVARAVAEKCADGSCRGPQGVPGQNAPSITPAELVVAVATYCSTGICVGPSGKDGTDGTDGTNGVDGQNATPEQIAAAVNAYCSSGACTGPEGVQGPAGRGLQSQYCGDDGRWVITYTDGAVQDGGQCRTTILGGP